MVGESIPYIVIEKFTCMRRIRSLVCSAASKCFLHSSTSFRFTSKSTLDFSIFSNAVSRFSSNSLKTSYNGSAHKKWLIEII